MDRGRAAFAVGRAHQELADYRLAVKHGTGSGFVNLHRVYWDLARAEGRSGNFARSLKFRQKGLDLKNRGTVGRAIRYSVLARYYAEAGDLVGAERSLERAREFRARAFSRSRLKPVNKVMIDAMLNDGRAGLLDAQGRFAEAESLARKAVAMWDPIRHTKSTGSVDPNVRRTSNNCLIANLAVNLRRQGRLVEAELEARRAVRGALRSSGRYSAHTADMLRVLNRVIYEQGRYSEAETLAQANLDIFRRTGVSDAAAFLVRSRLVLADAILAQGRWEEAMTDYDRARSALRSDPESYKTFVAGNVNLSLALINSGRAAEARDILDDLLASNRSRLGAKHYNTAEAGGVLAMALAAIGEKEKALALFRAAVKILLKRSRQVEGEETAKAARGQRLGLILEAYMNLLADIQGSAIESKAGVDAAAEAFRMAAVAQARSVQKALAASATRAAAKDPALADLARREQDAQKQIATLWALLARALNTPTDLQNRDAILDLRTKIDRLRGARAALMEEIVARFPDYAELINPRPATPESARQSLHSNEALISTYVGEDRTLRVGDAEGRRHRIRRPRHRPRRPDRVRRFPAQCVGARRGDPRRYPGFRR